MARAARCQGIASPGEPVGPAAHPAGALVSAATCHDCGERFQRDADEDWKRLCLRCWIATQPPRRPRSAPKADPIRDELHEHLRPLLMLCHPDKHAGSAIATNITQWLLSVRERIEVRT